MFCFDSSKNKNAKYLSATFSFACFNCFKDQSQDLRSALLEKAKRGEVEQVAENAQSKPSNQGRRKLLQICLSLVHVVNGLAFSRAA